MKAIIFLGILLVLVSACTSAPVTTTTTVSEQALQEAEAVVDQEIDELLENITLDEIENAITGEATSGV